MPGISANQSCIVTRLEGSSTDIRKAKGGSGKTTAVLKWNRVEGLIVVGE